jgi:hypothetical protein
MSFPTVAASNNSAQATATYDHTVNLPANISAGNLLLVFFVVDSNPTITFPEGWTQLFQAANSTYVNFGVWYRIADGGEGGTITVTTDDNKTSAHISYRITGHGSSAEAGTAVAPSGSTSPNPPSLSPTWGAGDTLWFACFGQNEGQGETVDAYPTNYTDGENKQSGSLNECKVAVARRELNAASEDPGTFTISDTERWVANTIAIKGALAQTLSPDGIASAEAFGTLKANFTLAPSGIATAEAMGDSVLLYTQFLLPDGIASAEAIGTHNLMYLQTLLPDAIASLEALGTPNLNYILFPTGIASDEAFGEPRLAFRLLMAAIESAEAFGNLKLGLYLAPDGIVSEEAVGEPKLNFILAPVGIASEEAVGTLKINFIISPTGIESAEAFGVLGGVVKPLFYIQRYTVEVHNTAGDLLAMLKYAYDVSYEQEVNASHVLAFQILADDPNLAYITKANELWLRDVTTGDVVRKFKLQHEIDTRDGAKITSKVTALDYMSLLNDKVFDFEGGTYMKYVAATAASLSNPIASDETHLYVADNVNWRVKKYLKSDMSYVAQSAALGGNVTAMAVDDTHVYFATDNDPYYVYQYTKTPFSYVGTTPGTGGIIKALVLTDDYFYTGGQQQTIKKWLKTTRAYVTVSPDYGGIIEALAWRGVYIFAGGQTNERVKKYKLSDLTYVTQSGLYGGVIYALATDSADYVYCGGATTNEVWQLNQSDLAKVASASYGGTVLALTLNYPDDSYVFAGGYTAETIKRYSTDPFLLHDYSPVYGAIYDLTMDATHIYAAGNGVVKKYSLYDTVEGMVDELLSYQVNVPAITLGTIAPAYADLVCDIQADGETIAEVLLNLRDILGGYIEVDNDRQLNWYEDIGEDKGQQIRYKKNLLGMEREIYWNALANRIYAYGRTTEGYKIRLSEILAVDYVEDVPSQTAWGGIFPQTFIAFDITEADTLLAYAEQRLDELKNPPLSYHIDSVDLALQEGFDFEKLQLGSIVRVIDEGLNINVEARVVKIHHPDLENPLKMEVEIATVVRDITKTIGDIDRLQKRQGNLLLQ